MPIYPMDAPKKNGLKKYRVAVSYTASDGSYKQVFRTAYGKDAAAELERKLIEEFKKGTPSARLTVSELVGKYLDAKRHEVRATTFDKSAQIFRTHLLPALGDERIDRLNAQRLGAWKNCVSDGPLGITMRKNLYKELNACLNWAVKYDYIPQNPLRKVGNFKDANAVEDAPEQLHYYTPDQFSAFARAALDDAVDSGDWRYYVFFAIAYYTGMRKGEINALRWSDVDLDRALIHVRRSVAQKLKGDDVETPPKNKSSYRDLQIPRPLLSVLADQRVRQQLSAGFSDDLRVAGGMSTLRDSSIERHNTLYASRAGIPHIRIHDFRHSHASLLANEGINIQEIARRLGHSNPEITWKVYAHLYPREEERAVAVLDKIPLPSAPIEQQEKQEKSKKNSCGNNPE